LVAFKPGFAEHDIVAGEGQHVEANELLKVFS
jgi:hypothetical protein